MSEIVLSLSSKLIQTLERLASKKGLSLEIFLTQEIEKWADREFIYQQAQERQISLMKRGINLGFENNKLPSRNSLHKR